MFSISKLLVRYHEQEVGTLQMSPDNRVCVFEYAKSWLKNGFSLPPLDFHCRKTFLSRNGRHFTGILEFLKTAFPLITGSFY